MAKQKLTINGNGLELLALYSGAANWDEADSTLTKLKGWDDFKNIELETVPKLFGHGSFVVSKRLKERDIIVDGAVYRPDARTLRDLLAKAAEALQPVLVTLERGTGNSTLEAYITGLEWEATDDDTATFSISLKSLEAMKTTGSTPIL